jgi:7,8-dihydro-6-hydroxymethylpterin dimethyltransferase
MTHAEIDAFPADPPLRPGESAMDRARVAIASAGCGSAGQQMGLRWPIGCVALEVTQRCNLDCSLCYLSENSEAVKDVPLEEVFRRIELIFSHYGKHTDVQVTGGDPTLRDRDELLAIVARISSLGMRPTLMTNGIRASRSLLTALAAHGLVDVVFHIDTTQQRRGFATEQELNRIRTEYLDRTRRLGLSVMFNTTVHDGNFHQIPELVGFFRAHAGAIRTASFQLQAATGRGVQRERGVVISPESVWRQIEAGAGTSLNFEASRIGHPGCNRYALCLEANGTLYDAFSDVSFITELQAATAGMALARNDRLAALRDLVAWLGLHPRFVYSTAKWLAARAWAMKSDLVRSRGRVRTLSFVIHNFMDAQALEEDRIRACVFKVMTGEGPMSMCMHNAKRDSFILRAVPLTEGARVVFWHPMTGELSKQDPGRVSADPNAHPFKRMKGQTRRHALLKRRAGAARASVDG